MPCHVDEIPANAAKLEISQVIAVVDGRIRFRDVGDDSHGRYPTVSALVGKFTAKYKTFHYRVKGTTMVVVTPCPKGC